MRLIELIRYCRYIIWKSSFLLHHFIVECKTNNECLDRSKSKCDGTTKTCVGKWERRNHKVLYLDLGPPKDDDEAETIKTLCNRVIVSISHTNIIISKCAMIIPNVMDLAKLELLTVIMDCANVVLRICAPNGMHQSARKEVVQVREKFNLDLNISLAFFIKS